jgi:hypothetical protein
MFTIPFSKEPRVYQQPTTPPTTPAARKTYLDDAFATAARCYKVYELRKKFGGNERRRFRGLGFAWAFRESIQQ